MKVEAFRIYGIRCFEDTGEVLLGPGCNIFVGRNNAGKSTLLKAITGLQLGLFTAENNRPGSRRSACNVVLSDLDLSTLNPNFSIPLGV